MDEIIFRKATIKDISFLVETIIEAEKAGTDVLPYSTIFGLSIEDIEKYLSEMLAEEIDGCELSISSFLVAENNDELIAASCAWIEGSEGLPSSILKGNLLNYFLPKICMVKASSFNTILHDLQFDYIQNTIHFGVGYVKKTSRGNNLLGILKQKQIDHLSGKHPKVTVAYVDIFGNNLPAIRTNEKMGFKVVKIKETSNPKVKHYLPSNKKVLMKKIIK